MAGKEKQHKGAADSTSRKHSLASGQPASPCRRPGAAPARGRSRPHVPVRNRGVIGQAQTVGLPVHKNGVVCATAVPTKGRRTAPRNNAARARTRPTHESSSDERLRP